MPRNPFVPTTALRGSVYECEVPSNMLSHSGNNSGERSDNDEDIEDHTITSVDDDTNSEEGFDVIIHEDESQDQAGPLASFGGSVRPMLSTSIDSSDDGFVKGVGFADDDDGTGYDGVYDVADDSGGDDDGEGDASGLSAAEEDHVKEKLYRIEKARSVRPFLDKRMSSGQLSTIELDDCPFPVSILSRFHMDIFIEHFLVHIFFPLSLPVVLWRHGVRVAGHQRLLPTKVGSIFFGFAMPGALWVAIALFVMFPDEMKEDGVQSAELVLAFLLFAGHRTMVAVKYAFLTDGEYEWFLTTTDRKAVDAFHKHKQLVTGWWNLDDLTIETHLAAAEIRAGVDLSRVHFSTNSKSKVQREKWQAFFQAKKYVKPHHNHHRRSLHLLKTGKQVAKLGSVVKDTLTKRRGTHRSIVKRENSEIELGSTSSAVAGGGVANVRVNDGSVSSVAPMSKYADGIDTANGDTAPESPEEQPQIIENEASDILPDKVTAQSVALALMRYCGKYGGFQQTLCMKVSLALGIVQFLIPGIVRWYDGLAFFGTHAVSTAVIICVCVNMVFFFSLLMLFFFVVLNDFNRRVLVYRRFGKMLRTDAVNRCCGAVVFTSHKYPGIDTTSPNQLRAWTLTRQVLHEFGGDILKRMNWYLLGGMAVAIVLLIWLVVLWANNFNDPSALRTNMVLHLCLFDVVTISCFCLACVVIGSKVNYEGENHSFLFAVKRIQLSNNERDIQKPKPEPIKQGSVSTGMAKQNEAPESSGETETQFSESAKEREMKKMFWSAPKKVRMQLMSDLREEVDYVLDAGIEMFQTLDELQPLQFLGAKASVASIGSILVVMFGGIALIAKEVFLS